MAMLVAQFAFGIPITFGLVYVLIPLYGKASQTYRAIIVWALPLVSAIRKVIVSLAAQRIDFLHPGDSHVLLNVLFSASAIVFRVMQADLFDITLFTLLSFAHGAIDLLERLSASMFGTLFTRSSKETRGKPFWKQINFARQGACALWPIWAFRWSLANQHHW